MLRLGYVRFVINATHLVILKKKSITQNLSSRQVEFTPRLRTRARPRFQNMKIIREQIFLSYFSGLR